jgi:hypothetical protein
LKQITPISPPFGPTQWLFHGPPEKSKFLAEKISRHFVLQLFQPPHDARGFVALHLNDCHHTVEAIRPSLVDVVGLGDFEFVAFESRPNSQRAKPSDDA